MRSHTRRPIRDALLEYAGPMPFFVVPMLSCHKFMNLIQSSTCFNVCLRLITVWHSLFSFLRLSFSLLQAIDNLMEIKDCGDMYSVLLFKSSLWECLNYIKCYSTHQGVLCLKQSASSPILSGLHKKINKLKLYQTSLPPRFIQNTFLLIFISLFKQSG